VLLQIPFSVRLRLITVCAGQSLPRTEGDRDVRFSWLCYFVAMAARARSRGLDGQGGHNGRAEGGRQPASKAASKIVMSHTTSWVVIRQVPGVGIEATSIRRLADSGVSLPRGLYRRRDSLANLAVISRRAPPIHSHCARRQECSDFARRAVEQVASNPRWRMA
jgi:hypothetical protein